MAESGYYDQYQGAAADEGEQYAEDEEYYEEYEEGKPKKGNILPIWVSNEQWPKKRLFASMLYKTPSTYFQGNQQSMNMNPLILTNIQNSPYFKVNLYEIKVRYKN